MFSTDLKKGKIYENKALNYFEYDAVEEPSKEDRAYYDWKLTNKDEITYIEVKADFMGSKTGNFACEIECNNMPSGITRTKANYYVIFVIGQMTEVVYIVPTNELREISKDCKTIKGGDGWRSKMHLVPLTKLKQFIHSC
jgi:hypothetical protein